LGARLPESDYRRLASVVDRIVAIQLVHSFQQHVPDGTAVRILRLQIPDPELHRDLAHAGRRHSLPAGLSVVQRVYSSESDQQPHYRRPAQRNNGCAQQLQAGLRAADSLWLDVPSRVCAGEHRRQPVLGYQYGLDSTQGWHGAAHYLRSGTESLSEPVSARSNYLGAGCGPDQELSDLGASQSSLQRRRLQRAEPPRDTQCHQRNQRDLEHVRRRQWRPRGGIHAASGLVGKGQSPRWAALTQTVRV